MNLKERIHSQAKLFLPIFVRRILRSVLHYFQRVGRWFIILWQVRGVEWQDQLVLILSALASPVLALYKPMSWQDPILLQDAHVFVPGYGRFFLRKHCDDLWHVLPHREQAIVAYIKTHLGVGDVFIDAGANIGIYTVMASKIVGSTGRVLAVEMMPDTADRLARHVEINGLENVLVIRKALGDEPNRTVVATVEKGKFGQASTLEKPDAGAVSTVHVDTATLDDISRSLASVRLLKMDLEGAEVSALQGGMELLSRLDFLVYEDWGAVRRVDDPVAELLVEAGFVLSQLDGNNSVAERVQACQV